MKWISLCPIHNSSFSFLWSISFYCLAAFFTLICGGVLSNLNAGPPHFVTNPNHRHRPEPTVSAITNSYDSPPSHKVSSSVPPAAGTIRDYQACFEVFPLRSTFSPVSRFVQHSGSLPVSSFGSQRPGLRATHSYETAHVCRLHHHRCLRANYSPSTACIVELM